MRIVFLTLIAMASLWVGGLISFYEKIPTSRTKLTTSPPDGIVVLTGGKGRIAEGTRLMNEKKIYWLLISGVHKDTKREQIEGYTDFGNISLGAEAKTTKGNAAETKYWVEQVNMRSVFLVTSNYHMPRSLSIFKREMPELVILPYPVFSEEFDKTAWYKDWNSVYLIVSEYNKYLITF